MSITSMTLTPNSNDHNSWPYSYPFQTLWQQLAGWEKACCSYNLSLVTVYHRFHPAFYSRTCGIQNSSTYAGPISVLMIMWGL